MSKICSKCKKQKLLTEFNTRTDRKSGYRSECKKCQYQVQSLRKRNIPVAYSRARNTLHYAVGVGNIIKPEQCDSCKEAAEVHGHHEDYLVPLKVDWLCVPCHNGLHRKRRLRA